MIQEYKRTVIFRFGRVKDSNAVKPGIYFINCCIEGLVKVDLRTRSFNVDPQEILTGDSVTTFVEAVVYYRVHSPLSCVVNVENADKSTKQMR